MTKGMKIGLGIGCGLIFIGAIVVVLGVIGLNYLERHFEEGSAAHEQEGKEFGRTHDQQACMTEGMNRSKKVGLMDLGSILPLAAFTDGCLKVSKPSPNFCDGVPGLWSMKDTEWGAAECRKVGIDPEKTACVHVTKRKLQFCAGM